MIRFKAVKSRKDIAEVVSLAGEIWFDHYVPIVGQDQVDYMLNKFQSEQALEKQIAGSYEYYLVERDGKNAGYIAIVPDLENASLMISKLYLKKTERGQGFGKEMLKFVEEICLNRGINKIWLTVNKYNYESIAWYQRRGFINAGPIVQDIGGGFVMDDYRMEKTVLPP